MSNDLGEVAAALDAYADLIWGLRWLLSPAVLAIMTLVMANAIGIGVRERAPEIAVLKVIGFRSWQILLLVLGEPMLIGALAGLLQRPCQQGPGKPIAESVRG